MRFLSASCKYFKNNSKGSVVVLALVATLAVSLIASVVGGYFLNLRKQQNRLNLINSLSLIQANILDTISSDSAWFITKTNNAPASNLNPNPFKLYDGAGTLIYDSTSATSGFTITGAPCQNWSSGGSSSCPLRLLLSWKQVAQCNLDVVPAFQITGSYSYAPGDAANRFELNWLNYSNQLTFCRKSAVQNYSCVNGPPAAACGAPDQWYCTSTGWICGRIFN